MIGEAFAWLFFLEWGADCLHMVELMPLLSLNSIICCLIRIQTICTLLAYRGCSGEEAAKWVFVCVAGYCYYYDYFDLL